MDTQFIPKLLGMDATLIYGGWFFLFMDGALPLIMLLGHLTRRVRPLPLYLFAGALFMPIPSSLADSARSGELEVTLGRNHYLLQRVRRR